MNVEDNSDIFQRISNKLFRGEEALRNLDTVTSLAKFPIAATFPSISDYLFYKIPQNVFVYCVDTKVIQK